MHRSVLALAFVLLSVGRLDAQSDSGFARWVGARAIPLDASARAFRVLDSASGGARLIGVGESVHDVQQFMELRLTLLQHLVRHARVTALVLESGMPEAMAVDDWVRGRTDSVDFTTQLGPDYHGSDVARRAISWLREWNLGAGKAHPVAVYGADISIGDGRSMLPALDRLHAVAGTDARITAVIDSLRPLATRVAAPWWSGALRNYEALPPDAKARFTELTTRLVVAAREWRRGTREQRAWAERLALVAQQDEVMLRRGPFSPEAPRDAAMAANTHWIVDRLPRGERAVLWAHNAHVQRTPIEGPSLPRGAFPSMGSRLGESLGAGYFAVGTAYGGPSVDSASAPRAGSVDAALGGIAPAPYLVPLRGAPRTGMLGAWLHAERPMRFQVGHVVLPLARAFDALVYFDSVGAVVRPH
jgi:erythromycin esterase